MIPERSRGTGPSAISFLAVAAVLFWPRSSFAWGPLAHLDFGSSAIQNLSAVSLATRALLTRFASEFLYGSLAADIIVGKNLSRYAVHCHNWKVGFSVLERARTDAAKAFSLGFLSHLAADTVAHNYYVPYKTVQGFRARANGHAYWELRFDQKLSPHLWKVARQIGSAEYRIHDDHLKECLADSHVLPFSISKTMFGSLLLAARLKKWQAMSRVLASERDLALTPEEVRECQALAIAQIQGMLRGGLSSPCTKADPTGERNLHAAGLLRTTLRKRPDLSDAEKEVWATKVRPAFREAISGRLALPELPIQAAPTPRGA